MQNSRGGVMKCFSGPARRIKYGCNNNNNIIIISNMFAFHVVKQWWTKNQIQIDRWERKNWEKDDDAILRRGKIF
jgi:hypothetical protein